MNVNIIRRKKKKVSLNIKLHFQFHSVTIQYKTPRPYTKISLNLFSRHFKCLKKKLTLHLVSFFNILSQVSS